MHVRNVGGLRAQGKRGAATTHGTAAASGCLVPARWSAKGGGWWPAGAGGALQRCSSALVCRRHVVKVC
jgi:hypothetical protein